MLEYFLFKPYYNNEYLYLNLNKVFDMEVEKLYSFKIVNQDDIEIENNFLTKKDIKDIIKYLNYKYVMIINKTFKENIEINGVKLKQNKYEYKYKNKDCFIFIHIPELSYIMDKLYENNVQELSYYFTLKITKNDKIVLLDDKFDCIDNTYDKTIIEEFQKKIKKIDYYTASELKHIIELYDDLYIDVKDEYDNKLDLEFSDTKINMTEKGLSLSIGPLDKIIFLEWGYIKDVIRESKSKIDICQLTKFYNMIVNIKKNKKIVTILCHMLDFNEKNNNTVFTDPYFIYELDYAIINFMTLNINIIEIKNNEYTINFKKNIKKLYLRRGKKYYYCNKIIIKRTESNLISITGEGTEEIIDIKRFKIKCFLRYFIDYYYRDDFIYYFMYEQYKDFIEDEFYEYIKKTTDKKNKETFVDIFLEFNRLKKYDIRNYNKFKEYINYLRKI